MLKKPEKKLSKPSEEFVRAFADAGSNYVVCEFCGRKHYAPNSDLDWEDGELERLNRLNMKDPEACVAHEEESIFFGRIDGKQFVDGCPCNLIGQYERFIIDNRYAIVNYLQERAERISRGSAEESQLARRAALLEL
ncbi:MAG: hypothetical protein WC548_04125 [Candidatus Pacearchaeota archaeon]